MDPKELGNRKRKRRGGKRVETSANADLLDLNALGLQLLFEDEQIGQQLMADFDWLQIDESLFV